MDGVTRWGTHSLWIYHLQDSRDAKAREITRSTISETELARLRRCLNMQLEIVKDGEKRGIRIVWARRGRSDVVLWDDTGCWKGMPEKIEAAAYDGLSKTEQEDIASQIPTLFPNPEAAVGWALEQGVFDNQDTAKQTYEEVKSNTQPTSAQEMAIFWVEHINKMKQSTPQLQAM